MQLTIVIGYCHADFHLHAIGTRIRKPKLKNKWKIYNAQLHKVASLIIVRPKFIEPAKGSTFPAAGVGYPAATQPVSIF